MGHKLWEVYCIGEYRIPKGLLAFPGREGVKLEQLSTLFPLNSS